MITLALDASTYVGDVAVLDDTRLLAEDSIAMKDPERERLMPAVQSVLVAAGISVDDVDRVVCGAGPGSFTSLRIAGAIAKGLSNGLRRPLFAADSMALIVGGANVPAGHYLTAVDALRGEFYVALYEVKISGDAMVVTRLEPARLVANDAVSALAAEWNARIIGPTLLPGWIQAYPKARAVSAFGSSTLNENGSGVWQVDVDSWEPSYGRLAEAQVKWEKAHGKPLAAG